MDGLPVPEQSHYIRPGALAVGQPIWCIRCRRAGHLDTASLTRVMMVTAGGLSCTRREWCLEGLPPPPGRTGPTTAEYPAVGCRQVKGLSGRLYRRLARSPSTHCFCFFFSKDSKLERQDQFRQRSDQRLRDGTKAKTAKKQKPFLVLEVCPLLHGGRPHHPLAGAPGGHLFISCTVCNRN